MKRYGLKAVSKVVAWHVLILEIQKYLGYLSPMRLQRPSFDSGSRASPVEQFDMAAKVGKIQNFGGKVKYESFAPTSSGTALECSPTTTCSPSTICSHSGDSETRPTTKYHIMCIIAQLNEAGNKLLAMYLMQSSCLMSA